MIRIVLCYRFCCYGIGYVRPAVQIVTITLPIRYYILSTTYSTNNYNVNISNESYRISEINKNNYKFIYISCYIPVVFVLDVVYTMISFTKRGSKYENG